MPLSAPRNYKIRDPRDNAQSHGKVANPPRYMPLGGLSGASKIKDSRKGLGVTRVQKPGEGR